MKQLHLYNTATRKVEAVVPIEVGKIGIYSCGPTVYWSPHIGNMYAYISWDILVRTARYLGYQVKQVMNMTDVGHMTSDADEGEDKMEKGARREGISVWEVAKKYEKEFMDNLELLNVNKPEVVCRATDHIAEQIDLLKKIEANGFTYKIDDGIYFDTSKFVGYADFAKLNLEQIKEGARVETNTQKRNASDFALWKFSPKDGPKRQMEWDSPWGVGFPGWHIECTAMSVKYLGEVFDIHTGGEDHIPIHHTNEIAQGYGAFGHQTANFWVHNAFITINGGKISKSSGGLYTVFDLVKLGFEPLDYRFMVINSYYKRGVEFSLDNLTNSKNGLRRLRQFFDGLRGNGKISEKYKSDFEDKIANDLAMPEAMALVWKLVKDTELSEADKKATLLDFDRVLGLNLGTEVKTVDITKEAKELITARDKARDDKNWTESDRIRKELEDRGFRVEDTKSGTKIKKW